MACSAGAWEPSRIIYSRSNYRLLPRQDLPAYFSRCATHYAFSGLRGWNRFYSQPRVSARGCRRLPFRWRFPSLGSFSLRYVLVDSLLDAWGGLCSFLGSASVQLCLPWHSSLRVLAILVSLDSRFCLLHSRNLPDSTWLPFSVPRLRNPQGSNGISVGSFVSIVSRTVVSSCLTPSELRTLISYI